jgi:MFS family permease
LLKNYRAWLAWFVASLFSLSIIIPEISLAFSANAAQIGTLSAAYTYIYALAQLPAGYLIDKYNVKTILPLAALITALGCYLFAQTNTLLTAGIGRGLIGFGSAFAFVACLKIASDKIAANKFALIVGLTNVLGAAGGLIGSKPYLTLVQIFDWRVVNIFSSYIALIFAVILWLIIEPNSSHQVEEVPSFKNLTKNIFSNRQLWLIISFGGLMIAPISTYTQLWGASFLQAHNNINLAQASLLNSTTFFGIALGGPLIGFLNNYFHSTKTLLYLGCIGALTSLACILLLNSNNALYLSTIHLLLGLFTSCMLLCFTLVTTNIHKRNHGFIIGILNSCIMLISGSFQIIAGKIIQLNNQSILIGMLPLIACHLLCLIIALKINTKD